MIKSVNALLIQLYHSNFNSQSQVLTLISMVHNLQNQVVVMSAASSSSSSSSTLLLLIRFLFRYKHSKIQRLADTYPFLIFFSTRQQPAGSSSNSSSKDKDESGTNSDSFSTSSQFVRAFVNGLIPASISPLSGLSNEELSERELDLLR